MSVLTMEQALENVYASLHDGNRDIDMHITALKQALTAENKKEAIIDPDSMSPREALDVLFQLKNILIKGE